VSFILGFGCATPAHNPLSGWTGGLSLYQGGHTDGAITTDYQSYIQKLPLQESQFITKFDIKFYEDRTGQHAVEISIPLNGTWRMHVLIYDKDDKRIKVIKYIGGEYRS
jgi:hypothetical protein